MTISFWPSADTRCRPVVALEGRRQGRFWFCSSGLAFFMALVATQRLCAVTNVWSNGGGTKLWVTSTDWSPAGPPTNTDTAAFFNTATAPFAGTVNNTVSVSSHIAALVYGQSNALYHTTKINSGIT